MRLDKYLSEMGVGTRSEIKKACKTGLVCVNGTPVKDSGIQIDSDSANTIVTYRGEIIRYEEYVYYMLSKPAGVISASSDPNERTVVALIDEQHRKDLFPVGRLDRDTEGLLLITNDGELAHRLLSPKHHVDKVYYAKVSGICTDSDVSKFREGIELPDGLTCLPADLRILSISEPDPTENSPIEDSSIEAGCFSEVLVTIHEGKFHQIKRMFLALGKEVLYLKRLSMGTLELDEALTPGDYRRLTSDQIDKLRAI